MSGDAKGAPTASDRDAALAEEAATSAAAAAPLPAVTSTAPANVPTDAAPRADGETLRIVAIGASAGGLEPMEHFFAALPTDTGCAFVVIQHLSPDFRSMMDELLARRTAMRIRRLEHEMALEPNCIHLNLPRSVVTVRGESLLLDTLPDSTAAHRPIDAFFSSLAEHHAESALAVVLSGTGSDGMHGCESIKEYGGTVLVQSPEEARFDSMPGAVIGAGLADAVASAERLADQVVRWSRGLELLADDGASAGAAYGEASSESERQGARDGEDPVGGILALIRSRYDTDFHHYKPATVARRMQRRADLRGMMDLERYRILLHQDPDELDELYGDLLIEVTAFFRDRAAFEAVEKEVVPGLIDRLREGDPLRIWIAGCASGEEAYSLAILLAEHAAAADLKLKAKILATDIHGRSLERAAAGLYPAESVRQLSDERIDAHFEREGEQVRVRSSLRQMLLFSTHDVVRDTPFTRIDLLSCRNLLIYLNPDAQERVLAKFHFALSTKSWLFLGPSENISGLEEEFEIVDQKWRLYRKRRDVNLLRTIGRGTNGALIPRRALGTETGGRAEKGSLQRPALPDEQSVMFRRAHQIALESIVSRHAPPGFLLTDSGEIVHIFGDAGRLLPMSQGAFSRRVTDLIEPAFRPVLFAALQTAQQADFRGFSRRMYLREESEEGVATPYDLSLERVDIGNEEHVFLLLTIVRGNDALVLDEAPPEAGGEPSAGEEPSGIDGQSPAAELVDAGSVELLQQRVRMLEQSLRASEESLQTTIEELETSNEELQSTNEELTASNEELQSTNEELHSVNEELYTVSAEHQRRIEELSELNDDVDNLLRASEIGTVFLDRDLVLRRYTDRARLIFGFGPTDVGRHIGSIRSLAPVDVVAYLEEVIAEREQREVDIQIEERQYLLRMLPYLDGQGELDGVLITNIDVTELTETRSALKRVDSEYRAIVEDTSSFIVRWRADDRSITWCNEAYSQIFDARPEELVGRDVRELIPPEERDSFFAEIAEIEPYESRYLSIVREEPDGHVTYTVGYSRAIADADGNIVEYQSTGQDLSHEYAYRRALEELVSTTKDTTLDHDTRLQRILMIGLDYVGLQSAFVSRIEGEDYHVVAVVGAAAEKYRAGDVIALEDTVCATLPAGTELMAIPRLDESELKDHACRTVSGVESFIGARLVTAEGNFGSLAFNSTVPRDRPFTVAEEGFMLLINSWVGYLVDHQHQLERIGHRNDYYRSLYLNVPVPMCLTDKQGCIVEVSEEWLSHLGLERERSVGRPFTDVIDEPDRDEALDAIRRGSVDDLSLCLRRADGELVEHEMSCRTRRIGTLGEMRLMVLTDVSERNRAVHEVEAQNRRLASANENLNQFAFVASHDLQEPLRKIQQFSSFLAEDFGDTLDDDGRYHMKVVVESAERMSALIRDLLEYSRTSRNALAAESVALDEILAQVRRDLELPLAESGATLEVDALPKVSGDPVLLVQLFSNLVGNAIKYRDPERALVVHVSFHAEDTERERGRRVVVEDNGIGFDPAYASRIFEPFTRLHGSKDYSGSGIGLAICTAVCDKHGWRLRAEGIVGRGSRFILELDQEETDAR